MGKKWYCEGASASSRNKDEIKWLNPPRRVFRVPVASTDYCVDKVKDPLKAF